MKERVHNETGGIVRKVLFFGLAGLMVMGIAAASGSDSGGSSPGRRAGSATVYGEIAAETSCSSLQATFDRGEATSKRAGRVPDATAFEGARGARWSEVGLGYMDAADNRMREIGCY